MPTPPPHKAAAPSPGSISSIGRIRTTSRSSLRRSAIPPNPFAPRAAQERHQHRLHLVIAHGAPSPRTPPPCSRAIRASSAYRSRRSTASTFPGFPCARRPPFRKPQPQERREQPHRVAIRLRLARRPLIVDHMPHHQPLRPRPPPAATSASTSADESAPPLHATSVVAPRPTRPRPPRPPAPPRGVVSRRHAVTIAATAGSRLFKGISTAAPPEPTCHGGRGTGRREQCTARHAPRVVWTIQPLMLSLLALVAEAPAAANASPLTAIPPWALWIGGLLGLGSLVWTMVRNSRRMARRDSDLLDAPASEPQRRWLAERKRAALLADNPSATTATAQPLAEMATKAVAPPRCQGRRASVAHHRRRPPHRRTPPSLRPARREPCCGFRHRRTQTRCAIARRRPHFRGQARLPARRPGPHSARHRRGDWAVGQRNQPDARAAMSS